MKVLAIHRDPFALSPHAYHVPEGETLAGMAARVKSLPEGWPRHEADAICINGEVVPRGVWHLIRPHAVSASSGVPLEVSFHAPPMGGGGGDGKNVLGIVASIGLIALSGGVASAVGLFAGAAPGSAAAILGTASRAAFLGKLAGAAVLIGGSALLQALSPTPSIPTKREDDGPRQLGSASVSGNVLEPNGALPRVVGTRKVFPPFATEPLVYFDGEQEVAEALAALAGPHKLEDIRIGEAAIEDAQGVEFETREGWPGLDPLTLLTRYGRTVQDGVPIRGHLVSENDKDTLESLTGKITDALPPAKVIASRSGPDEFWIGIQFSQGLAITTDQDTQMRVPLRLRIRRRGETDWTNLPELHFRAAQLGTRRATIKFAWRDGPVNVSAVSSQGWVEARIVSPGQAITPTTDDWVADSYFDADAGGDHYVTATNAATTDVINVIAGDNEAEFQLDRAVFPPDIYEVEIKRGYAFKNSNYSSASYQISGSLRDPFHFQGDGSPKIFQTRNNLIDELTLVRYSSVWNGAPVRKGGVALLAVRARDVRVDRLSVLASGYVRDWDGTDWTDWKTTNNPAPHIRDTLAGPLNATPIPVEIIDDDSLTDLRTAAFSCNAVFEGRSVGEAIRIMAGTAFAQPYQSDLFGVIRDRDRSADVPVQVFTPQNSADFSASKAFPKMPDGFRATFVDADRDYEPRQIIHPEGASRTEQETIEGLVTEAQVRARIQYDLDAAKYRSAFFSWDAASDAIICRRGSLVGAISDVLDGQSASGRIADYRLNASGDVTAIRIDNEPDLTAEPDWLDVVDVTEVSDVRLIGARFGIAVIRAGQTVTTHEAEVSALGAEWVDLVTPATLTGLDYGDRATIGPLAQEYRRLLVIEMRPRDLHEWTITAVPEAPEIWQ